MNWLDFEVKRSKGHDHSEITSGRISSVGSIFHSSLETDNILKVMVF